MKKYNGAGVYGLYNVADNKIYIGLSKHIQTRFIQHRAMFKAQSEKKAMYKEPIENFVFLILHKLSDKDFDQFGRMFEILFISLAQKNGITLYNVNDTYNPICSVYYAFRIQNGIENAIYSALGTQLWMLKMQKRENRLKHLERVKEV